MIEVDDFTQKFTDEKLTGVLKIQRNFFQVSDELLAFKNQIDKEPFAIGTFLGSGKPLHPSVGLLQWVGERSDRFVTVDRKAAWLFLCGRDVFGASVAEHTQGRGPILVKNDVGEVLGYGKYTNARGQSVAVKNELDLGDFLRREK